MHTGNNSFIYSYDKSGKLAKIVSQTPRLTVIWRLNNEYTTPGITFAASADSILFDEYGRLKSLQSGIDANGGSAEYDNSGRLKSYSIFLMSVGNTDFYTYKNGLISKIVLETYNNVSRNTIKTVTNVKYEYKNKRKK